MDNEMPYGAPPTKNKPYRETVYRAYSLPLPSRVVGDYRWYWQANLVSWFLHTFCGKGCHTWKTN